MRTSATALSALAALAFLTGCPPIATDQPLVLTDGQKAAAKDVTDQLVAAGKLLGTLQALSADALNPDTIGQIGQFGTCPAVSFVANAQTAAIQFKFGDAGCSSDLTGGDAVSGALTITLTRATRSAAINFADLTVDGRAIDGTATAIFSRAGAAAELAGDIDAATTGIGTIEGTLTASLGADGVLTIKNADVTVNNGTSAYRVVFANVVCDPVGNKNFVPESGTATFEVPTGDGGALTVVVTFTSQTPSNGGVTVSVAGSAEISHTIPGIP